MLLIRGTLLDHLLACPAKHFELGFVDACEATSVRNAVDRRSEMESFVEG
jgi:hypothetical protein